MSDKQPNQNECFFCKKPLTSDDFKLDKIEKTKNFIAHRICVDKAMVNTYFKNVLNKDEISLCNKILGEQLK